MAPEIVFEGRLSVASIHCEDRLRPVSETALEALRASFEQLGVMTDAIHVRKITGKKARYVLIAGGHRLELAKRLGWEEIDCKVWKCSAEWARLMEIDDNLASNDLDALELSVFLAERKAIYERLHPETKRGKAGAAARWDATDIVSFVSSVAEKRQLAERHIRRFVSIGERLTRDQTASLFAMAKRPTQKDLLDLSRLNTPEDRGAAVAKFASGEAKTARDAIKMVMGEPASLTDEQKKEHRLQDAWNRAGIRVKRLFLLHNQEELRRLLDGLDEEAA
ncbi:MAG: ParB N-terminal domain-containing protein [Pseudomonadota bacterium]